MFDGNRVTAHTRSRYPIFQSPMTWIARAPLVTAVSKAGAMGLLENSIRDLAVTKKEFTAIRAATNAPFGVNLPIRYLQMDPAEEKAIIDWLLRQGIHFVTTSAGDPTRYTKLLKAAGVTVYHATATLRGAQKAADAGVDGLIVEGAESAGIRNPEEVHTFALLQAVREKVDLPIVAAGGIVDGRGMAAAFALGAEGVTMGTRFVASFESPVHPNYKNAIVAAPLTGTIMTDNPPRARSRGLRTPYSVEVAEGKRERLPRGGLIDMLYVQGDVENTSGAAGESAGLIDMLYVQGDVENTSGAAGESAGLIHELKSVQQIVDETIAGFWREIDRLAGLRPA